jgi:hypothetical protein
MVLRKIVCGMLAGCLLLCTLVGPVQAESFFTVRRTFGVLFLGSSALLAKRAMDFRSDANGTFEQYELAANARQAEELFQRTSDRDTKSQMAAGISVVLLVSGLRLLLSSGADNNIPKMDRGLKVQKKDLAVQLKSDVATRQVGVAITKGF